MLAAGAVFVQPTFAATEEPAPAASETMKAKPAKQHKAHRTHEKHLRHSSLAKTHKAG
jgi:hypothetical protein